MTPCMFALAWISDDTLGAKQMPLVQSQGRPTLRPADSRYALEIRASLRRISSGWQATRP
jgi:hypothetical protein